MCSHKCKTQNISDGILSESRSSSGSTQSVRPVACRSVPPSATLEGAKFFFIQTLPNDCSHIEIVHLLFSAHFIFFSFLGVLNLDIFSIHNASGMRSLCNM